MSNISITPFAAVANDASDGDVAWSLPSNGVLGNHGAGIDDFAATCARVHLTSGSPTSQWLVVKTPNWFMGRAPQDSVVGLELRIQIVERSGFGDVKLLACKRVINGVISGDDVSGICLVGLGLDNTGPDTGIAADSFTGTDGSDVNGRTMDGSADVWSVLSGAASIQSNAAVTTGATLVKDGSQTPAHDLDLSINPAVGTGVSLYYYVDSNNWLEARSTISGAKLFKKVAGVETQLGSTGSVQGADRPFILRKRGKLVGIYTDNGSGPIPMMDPVTLSSGEATTFDTGVGAWGTADVETVDKYRCTSPGGGSSPLYNIESNQSRNPISVGGGASLWGLTPAPADIDDPDSGVAFRVDGGGEDRWVYVYAVQDICYWNSSVLACVATAKSPTTLMAPAVFHWDTASESTWKTQKPPQVDFDHSVRSAPEGYAHKFATDFRPGYEGIRDVQTKASRWAAAMELDVAGDYTVGSKMWTNGVANAPVTTDSDDLAVTITADTRTALYVDFAGGNDSNDGLSPATAFKTLEKLQIAMNAVGADCYGIVKDDGVQKGFTTDPSTRRWVLSNCIIKRSGDGVNKPRIRIRSGDFAPFSMNTIRQFQIRGIRVEFDGPPGRLRQFAVGGNIDTIAGIADWESSGDGGAAVDAAMRRATGLFYDGSGNAYVVEQWANRVRKIATGTNVMTTVVGSGTINPATGEYDGSYSGDGGAATAARLNRPTGCFVAPNGLVVVADTGNHVVRAYNPTGSPITWLGVTVAAGQIETVAGTGVSGFSGDGGAATSAKFWNPTGVFVSSAGLWIADRDNNRVRFVDASTHHVSTVAGGGTDGHMNIDATLAVLKSPVSVCVNAAGDLFVCDRMWHCVFVVDHATGFINVFAGSQGSGGYTDDAHESGVPATQSHLWFPNGICLDGSENLVISDMRNQRVRRVLDSDGTIHNVAGGGAGADGGPATSAELLLVQGVAVEPGGDYVVVDQFPEADVSFAADILDVQGLSLIDCETDGWMQSLLEIGGGDSNRVEGLFIFNCVFRGIRRYGLYGAFHNHWVMQGSILANREDMGGEGMVRCSADKTLLSNSFGVTFSWCRFDGTIADGFGEGTPAALRMSWAFQGIQDCHLLGAGAHVGGQGENTTVQAGDYVSRVTGVVCTSVYDPPTQTNRVAPLSDSSSLTAGKMGAFVACRLPVVLNNGAGLGIDLSYKMCEIVVSAQDYPAVKLTFPEPNQPSQGFWQRSGYELAGNLVYSDTGLRGALLEDRDSYLAGAGLTTVGQFRREIERIAWNVYGPVNIASVGNEYLQAWKLGDTAISAIGDWNGARGFIHDETADVTLDGTGITPDTAFKYPGSPTVDLSDVGPGVFKDARGRPYNYGGGAALAGMNNGLLGPPDIAFPGGPRDAVVGTAFSATPVDSGDDLDDPPTYALGAGALPDGVTLTDVDTGTCSGTPTGL